MSHDFTFEFLGSDEASAKELTSFYRWLREDAAAHDEVKVEIQANPAPDAMGAADVLCMVLTQLTGIGGLALAYASWRGTRRTAPSVRIRLGEATIDVTDATAEQLAAALHALAEASPTPPIGPDSAPPAQPEA
jgi:hypothetical protein